MTYGYGATVLVSHRGKTVIAEVRRSKWLGLRYQVHRGVLAWWCWRWNLQPAPHKATKQRKPR